MVCLVSLGQVQVARVVEPSFCPMILKLCVLLCFLNYFEELSSMVLSSSCPRLIVSVCIVLGDLFSYCHCLVALIKV